MTRKQFIEQQRATCKNWNWSWSFINETEKIVIFGAWDTLDNGALELILSPSWEYNNKNKKNRGYKQSLEHIGLILNNNYILKTFKIYHSDENKNKEGIGPSKISRFDPVLEEKQLIQIDGEYFASSIYGLNNIAEEIPSYQSFEEGAKYTITVNAYERNPEARKKCLEHYGFKCQACQFDFEDTYGELGKNYIHVHHRVPLYQINSSYMCDPIKDLIPLCANCHSMIHRRRKTLSLQTLIKLLNRTDPSIS
ncbi:HNH endonuclease [Aquimarina sp. SS2-1]|uniref:HNH endonuclease n=1 Tax=Aquimarina besae TaxID=3342247 RepID=UPI0036726F4C